MIDKAGTIARARARFREIRPCPRKRSLEECFFSIHGKVLFRFRTPDNQFHTIRALEVRTSVPVQHVARNVGLVLQAPHSSTIIRATIVRMFTEPLQLSFRYHRGRTRSFN